MFLPLPMQANAPSYRRLRQRRHEMRASFGYGEEMTKDESERRLDDQRRAAIETLASLRHESEILGSSALARTGSRLTGHFLARDATDVGGAAADPIELWGRRIGRALSLAAFIGLSIYLYVTYLR
jgi:hypothetical protein